MTNGSLLKATGLWRKTSAKGNTYLTGRLGGLRVLVMENRDRQSDSDPTHVMLFGEAMPAAAPAPEARPPRRTNGTTAKRRAAEAAFGRPFDDPLPEQMR